LGYITTLSRQLGYTISDPPYTVKDWGKEEEAENAGEDETEDNNYYYLNKGKFTVDKGQEPPKENEENKDRKIKLPSQADTELFEFHIFRKLKGQVILNDPNKDPNRYPDQESK